MAHDKVGFAGRCLPCALCRMRHTAKPLPCVIVALPCENIWIPVVQWDAVENKSTVVTYAGGAVVALWLTSVVVGAINSVPLLPKIMELVGLGYTGWFVCRYLLFKQRKQGNAKAERPAKRQRELHTRHSMAATAYSTAALLGGARLAAGAAAAAPPSVLLPRRSMSPLRLQDAPRLSLLRVKASSDDTSTSAASGDELIADLQAKWDAVEDKSTVLTYAGGAVVALWLTSVVVGAINSVPLLPKIMELVGLGYTGWFVYRYLLFKESRKELADDIESLKKKIAGTE